MTHKKEIQDFVVANFLFGDGARLVDDASFLDTGIVDSAGILELVNFLESAFGITIESDEMLPDNLDSINRVDTFLKRKLSQNPQSLAGKCPGTQGA
jgi:acyl carrier protein